MAGDVCADPNASCTDGKCKCDAGYLNQDGTCKSKQLWLLHYILVCVVDLKCYNRRQLPCGGHLLIVGKTDIIKYM